MAPHKSREVDKMKALKRPTSGTYADLAYIRYACIYNEIRYPSTYGVFYFYFLDRNNYVIVIITQTAISMTTTTVVTIVKQKNQYLLRFISILLTKCLF